MIVHIELDKTQKEPIILIKTNKITKEIEDIQNLISKNIDLNITFYKDNKEYYFKLENILFFETNDNCIFAHTKDDVYKVKYKLYELENLLPRFFIRISKSTIINLKHVFSIEKNITSYSLIQFYNSHKQVYVSRLYYKVLKIALEERKNL